MTKPKIIAVVGPTASGKTALAVWLAKRIQAEACGAEIISADSRQVYKSLNIGTGKVTRREMAGVPHYLLDVASPKKQFSVDDFVRLAKKAHSTILKNGNVAIVVGGTGLYVDMFLGRMSYPEVPPNPALRARLEKYSAVALLAQLKKLDPKRAASIEPHNKRRIIRAIEIAKKLGKTPPPTPHSPYDVLWLGLNPGQKKLHHNIHKRLVSRMRAGMVGEAKRLHAQGLSYVRMEELGLEYRYLAHYLQKHLTHKELGASIEHGNRNYAKRQMRWFKRNKEIHWIKSKTEALKLAKKFIGGHK